MAEISFPNIISRNGEDENGWEMEPTISTPMAEISFTYRNSDTHENGLKMEPTISTEVSFPSRNGKQLEMEPTISTPLTPNTKRKRPQMETRRKKKKKKMYRPKVIGEGRARKRSTQPVKPKPPRVKPKPKPRPKTKKIVTTVRGCQQNSYSVQENDQVHIIDSCIDLVNEKALLNKVTVSCKDLVLIGNELNNEKASPTFTVSEKASAEVASLDEKESADDHSKSTVIQTKVGSTGRLYEWLHGIPQKCRRKRSSRRPAKITKRAPYGLRFGNKKGEGSRNNLQPFIYCKRKRSPMVRRCNVASALEVCKLLRRNTHKHASNTKKAIKNNGRDDDDDDETTKQKLEIEGTPTEVSDQTTEMYNHSDDGCQSHSALSSKDREASEETAIAEDWSGQTMLPAVTFKFAAIFREGTFWKISNAIRIETLSHNGKQTMRWLDIRQFLTNLKPINEKNPSGTGISLPRIITGFHDVGSGRSLIRQQDFTHPGSVNEMRPALNVILWNRSEGTKNNHEHIRLTLETRGISNSSGLTHVNSQQKEGTASGHEKKIVPYARKQGKKTSKGEHNLSYVNGMEGAIVPHPESLNSTKKKLLGKVNLDPRDITMWTLITQEASDCGSEKVDVNTEKWWAHEREIFRVRIDAFNARMHLILGDRRFSPWKGSVVDSVVGVFLTQNVSDHLSSSAYMSLAATFPLCATRNHTEYYQGQDVFCTQQSTQRNKGYFLYESEWNNDSMLESNKKTGDREEVEQLISANDAILSQDFMGSSVKQSLDDTLHSSTCFEDDCGIGLFTNLDGTDNMDGTDNTVLHPNKSTSVQEPYSSSPTSTSSHKSNQENEILESKEVEVDLRVTPNEKSQSSASAEKFQNQEIQLTGDVNDLEDRDSNDFSDEKMTDISKGTAKKSKMKPEMDWNSLKEKWDSMRRTYSVHEPRSRDHMDSVDWEEVGSADPIKIAAAIKERGQHNTIARRIKEFINRTARMHGHIDLEWLRYAPPNDVKAYLLEIHGLGLKSVECVRLLSLQQVAFPVDVNVGRIAVRIGWVPLEPLPEEVQIHLLETFPMMDSIQKYLWPRLSSLDQRTLYELHYQLITFGKVFCTKRKPNCNACPLRAECRHYASKYASARLALPGLPEKRMVSTMIPEKRYEGTAQVMNPAPVLHVEGNPSSESRYETINCEPIIEVPRSPEHAYDESQSTDIEDLYEYDSDDVPVIRLDSGQFTTSQNCMDNSITGALIPLNDRVASIPMRKLKHVDRLRTEHQVYELPDTHPLLYELEPREINDACPYLLCIWSPGETVDSSEPPNTKCTYQGTGELCSEGSCSSCNILRKQNSGTVHGTILIPCRTAMRGKFPLNGTYFQVNEVFADDESSKNPISVFREWIWDLPRRIVYFGTSTATIFRGLGIDDIQYCFQKGFICVRGFDRRTRTPKRLTERLHRQTNAAAKARANKNTDQKP
ncbi:protein ROS1-like [Cucurbita maxima]|uniref:Protein ROS1-like n=1 Tax=Cucurbita maxima TaxID=3661 RepID=A0A6J1K0Y6_CUCMA|nr:protein ROS1-like [Cucurbita maxima]